MPARNLPPLLFFCALAGCTLYLGGDDGDRMGDYGDDTAEDCANLGASSTTEQASLRNPHSGECQLFSTSPEDPSCAPGCGDCRGSLQQPIPTWGLCESPCAGLDEMACVTSGACRAIYMDWCPGAGCPDARVYTDCWPTDTSGPLVAVPHDPPWNQHCLGLDAQACSTYADCSPVHKNSCDQQVTLPDDTPSNCVESTFVSCEPEKMWCYEGDSCGAGYTCNAETLCETAADCDPDEPGAIPCPCVGFCIPDPSEPCSELDEATCIDRDDCTPLYEGPMCDPEENEECSPPEFSACVE